MTRTTASVPGHSEHHSGRAFDIWDAGCACGARLCRAEHRAAVWATANGHLFISVRAAKDTKGRGI